MWNYCWSWFSAGSRPPSRCHEATPTKTQRSGTSSKGGRGEWGREGEWGERDCCRARRCYHHCNPVWLRLSVSPLGCHGRGTLPSRGRDPPLRSQLSPHTTRPTPPHLVQRPPKISPESVRLLLSVCPLKSCEVKQIDGNDISMHTKKLFWYAAPFVCG